MYDSSTLELLMFIDSVNDFSFGDFLIFIWNTPLTLIIAISGTIYGWIWYRPFYFEPRRDLLPSWISVLITTIAVACWVPYIIKLLILIKFF